MLIGLIALGVRLLYILAIAPAPTGVGGDAGFYHSSANLIAHGHFLYRGIFGHAYRTAEHPPLYPLVLSLSSLAGGDTLLAHRIVSCVIGSCGVILVGILGRQVADDRAGLIAGAIAAVYPPFVTADGLVMSEPLFVVTVAGALIAALALLRHPTTARAALLGAVIGLPRSPAARGSCCSGCWHGRPRSLPSPHSAPTASSPQRPPPRSCSRRG